ncbi:PDR/VanB family oxidoreductase [Planosporangium mesophilum]|uniref:Ferredoxin n=1 Tax=Planosporangium mesophilum TaxID=689768 RepID=A0A8J3TDZ5_9ACTN|nr:PDR/VanB family oxidoreductase [Planosporangium mesophilum]NJC85894.1 oxidoreductase [Planosporangium mesophilum]GII25058.1 ferredoxin [Planosporangium mesophilum]
MSSTEPVSLLVAGRDVIADDVVVLTLRDAGANELPEWTPGAHIDILTGDSMSRQYSLCGDPADRGAWRIAVLRDPASRGGSRFVHDGLSVGSTVGVRGPRNHFPLQPAERYLFVAGGIGITPILPMIAAAESRGAPWRLLYGGRRRASMAFVDELGRYGDRVLIRPEDEYGLLDLASVLAQPRTDTLVYACGPEPLLRAVEEHCGHWPAGSLHVERFTAKTFDDEPAGADTFEVEFKRSGVTATVPPDKSIMEVAEEAGIFVLSSCMEGTCGTCETTVVEGEPVHRDSILTPQEQAAGDTMMICVSRCRSPRLVLDL